MGTNAPVDRASGPGGKPGSGGFKIEPHAAAQRRRDVDQRVEGEGGDPAAKQIVDPGLRHAAAARGFGFVSSRTVSGVPRSSALVRRALSGSQPVLGYPRSHPKHSRSSPVCSYSASLRFLGDSLKCLRDFPDDARHDAGYQLDKVQRGDQPDDFKPMPTIGKGVEEIRVSDPSGRAA